MRNPDLFYARTTQVVRQNEFSRDALQVERRGLRAAAPEPSDTDHVIARVCQRQAIRVEVHEVGLGIDDANLLDGPGCVAERDSVLSWCRGDRYEISRKAA